MRALSPAARVALVGVGVLALLAVVGLASRGSLSGGGAGHGPPSSLLDYGFSIFLVAYVLAIPFALWAFAIRQRDRRLRNRGGKGLGPLSNVVVFVALVAVALGIVAIRQARGDQQRLRLPEPPATGQGGRQQPAAQAPPPQFQWSVVVVTAALGSVALAAFLVGRRRRGPRRTGSGLSEQLAFALDDAIDDVHAEPDPRRAVIKAYARTEQILAAHGLPRHAAEAPFEYLARTLETLAASAGSAERLTGLFERAKFSLHEIGPESRDEAIGALTAVRDELRQRP
jgi:hypothetical protein